MNNPAPASITAGVILFLVTFAGAAMDAGAKYIAGIFLLVLLFIVMAFVMRKVNVADKPQLKLIGQLFGYNIKGCGCAKFGPKPKAKWIESRKVMERSEDGARIKFERKKAGMKRCVECGNRFHKVHTPQYNRSGKTVRCWPEEEDETREDLSYEVIE